MAHEAGFARLQTLIFRSVDERDSWPNVVWLAIKGLMYIIGPRKRHDGRDAFQIC